MCSVLLGVPSLLIAAGSNWQASAEVPYGNPNSFWLRAKGAKELHGCDWATAHQEPSFTDNAAFVTCNNKHPLLPALPWAFVPGLILGAIGYTVAWIVRGFRKENHNL